MLTKHKEFTRKYQSHGGHRKHTQIFYDENNNLYYGRYDCFLVPISSEIVYISLNKDDWKRYHPQDYKKKLPIICRCGNSIFQVIYTESYETSARCITCGHTEVVHSG